MSPRGKPRNRALPRHRQGAWHELPAMLGTKEQERGQRPTLCGAKKHILSAEGVSTHVAKARLVPVKKLLRLRLGEGERKLEEKGILLSRK